MADDALSWQFQLYDEISAPANNAAAGVEKIVKEMTAAEQVSQGFEKDLARVRAQLVLIKGNPGQFRDLQLARKELGDLQRSLAPASSDAEKMVKTFRDGAPIFAGLGAFGIAQGASLLVSAGEKYLSLVKEAANVVYGFAEAAVKAVAKSETIGLSFELMLGKDVAAQTLADVAEIAGRTKFDDDDLKQALRPLLLSGIRDPKQIADALAAAVDVEAIVGGGQATVHGFLDAVEKVRNKGGIGEKQLLGFGVNAAQFYKDLGQQLNVTAEAAEKLASEGKVDPQRILTTIYRTIAAKQGGALGIAAERAADTVEAKLYKLQQLPENYLKKFLTSPGFTDLSKTLGDILSALDPESPNGQRIYKALEGLFNDLMRWVRDITTPGNIEALAQGFATALDFSRTLLATVKQVFEVFSRFVELTGKIATAPFKLGSFLTGESGAEETAVRAAAAAAGARRAAALLGYSDLLADVGIALPALSPRGEGIAPSRSRGNRAPLMTLTIPIDARGAKGDEAAEAIADKLKSTAVPQIKSLLETFAAQQGVQDDDG
jgi:hypothetical protein